MHCSHYSDMDSVHMIVDEKYIKPRANGDALYANWVNVDSIEKDNMAFDHFEILQYALNL